MGFEWKWEAVDEARVKTACKIPADCVCVDAESGTAIIEGTPDRKTGEVIKHEATLAECTCQDFAISLHRKKPCKHILRLGMELGLINEDGLSPAQQLVREARALMDRLALCAGYESLFGERIVPDDEYADLVQRYNALREKLESAGLPYAPLAAAQSDTSAASSLQDA